MLKNAIYYSDKNSIIDVTAWVVDEQGRAVTHIQNDNNPETEANNAKQYYQVIAIRNQGIIPRDKLAKIFDKFYRLDDARSTHQGGSGLGLAIAREIVLAHGGQINADVADGWTMFQVVLPIRR